jgi:hypothetical protein
MTLEATTGSELPAGAISLHAGSGIVLHDSMTALGSGKPFVLHSDSESAGDGTLTLAASKQITTNDGTLQLTAWDIDMAGSATAGTASITVHGAKVDQTIALGETAQDMQITDAEFGRMTAADGFTLGSSNTGDILVHGITDASSDAIGTLTLLATKHAKTVTFATTASSFNKGIIVQAMGGIVAAQSVTTKACITVFSAGTGTLTVAASRTISSTSQILHITTDDVDVAAYASVDSGTVSTTMLAFTPGQEVAFGTSPKDLYITDSEFGAFTAVGLTFGDTVNADILVNGVTTSGSNGISQILSIVATRDDAQIQFSGTASTFNILASQADNGVMVEADITTTTAGMYLDSDAENSSSSDSVNSIMFTDGRKLSAKTVLTLEASVGLIVPNGDVTLEAGTGIVLLDSVQGASSSNELVINADYEVAGDGTFTVVTGRTVITNNCVLTVTAWDIDLDGGVDSGTEATNIHGAKLSQTIGVGATAKDMHLENDELQRITMSGGLHFGADIGGMLSSETVTSAGTSTIQPLLSLVAYRDDQQVAFDTAASSFHALAAQADNGVVVKVDVTTTVGGMYLDGDMEDSSSEDSVNTIGFTDAVTVSAAAVLTLEATAGDVVPTGSTTFNAGTGIVIFDDILSASTSSVLNFNADYESAGDGTLTIVVTKTIVSNKSDVIVTAWDLDFDGSITSGTKPISLHGAKALQTIGIGGTSADMHLSNSEVQRITTSGGLTIGSSVTGLLTLDGVSKTDSNFISPIVTLVSKGSNQQILLTGDPSTFIALAMQADNGISVNRDISTTTTSLHINADMNDTHGSASSNHIDFADGVTVTSKTLLTLQATTIAPAGSLTLRAGNGITLLDNLSSVPTGKVLVILTDYESAGDGTLTIATSKTITSNKGDVIVTAWDLDFDGSITSGTHSISIHGAKVLQTIGIGGTSADMHLSNSEVQRITTSGGLTVGSSVSGLLTLDGIAATESLSISPIVTLVSKGSNQQILVTAPSTFIAVSMQADNGIIVKSDITTSAASLYMNGDLDGIPDAHNMVGFTDGLTLTAKTTLTLQSSTGVVQREGTLSLMASTGVVFLSSLTT